MSESIGELFVRLGFKTDNKKVSEFKDGLSSARATAIGLKIAIAGLVFGVSKFTTQSTQNAVELKNFAFQTDLSREKLLQWGFVARRNDITFKELIGTIKNIQKAQAAIKLGTGNVRPWQLLGISPTEDPFKVLEALRKSAKDIEDPAIFTNIITQLGVSDKFLNVLRKTNLEFDKLDERFILSEEEQLRLLDLNITMKDFIFAIGGLRDRVIALNATTLSEFIKSMMSAALLIFEIGSNVGDFLNKMKEVKIALTILGVGLAAVFAPVTTAIAAVILLLDDLQKYRTKGGSVLGSIIETGKEAFSSDIDSRKLVKFFREPSEGGIKGARLKLFNLVTDVVKEISGENKENFKSLLLKSGDVINKQKEVIPKNLNNFNNPTNTKNTTNQNRVTINVSGTGDPESVAQNVMNQMQKTFSQIYYETPVLGV